METTAYIAMHSNISYITKKRTNDYDASLFNVNIEDINDEDYDANVTLKITLPVECACSVINKLAIHYTIDEIFHALNSPDASSELIYVANILNIIKKDFIENNKSQNDKFSDVLKNMTPEKFKEIFDKILISSNKKTFLFELFEEIKEEKRKEIAEFIKKGFSDDDDELY